MKAEILTWTQLAKREEIKDTVVLLDGGLVTARQISGNISTITGSRPKYYFDYLTPWGTFRSTVVRGEFMVAVIESGVKSQEEA